MLPPLLPPILPPPLFRHDMPQPYYYCFRLRRCRCRRRQLIRRRFATPPLMPPFSPPPLIFDYAALPPPLRATRERYAPFRHFLRIIAAYFAMAYCLIFTFASDFRLRFASAVAADFLLPPGASCR